MPYHEIALSPRHDAAVAELYPEVADAGGLKEALRRVLATFNPPLSPNDQSFLMERVELGDRFCQVSMAAEERLFMTDFWARGVWLAGGSTPELPALAGAIHRWLTADVTTTELRATFAFVVPTEDAASYETGQEVEHRWQTYLRTLPADFPELADLVKAAAAEPRLRQLFAYTSLNRLCFSRCTGYPFSWDVPHVRPLPGNRYEAVSPKGHPLGQGDAGEVVRLVVENLPPDCGPAVPGTADQFRQPEVPPRK